MYQCHACEAPVSTDIISYVNGYAICDFCARTPEGEPRKEEVKKQVFENCYICGESVENSTIDDPYFSLCDDCLDRMADEMNMGY